MTPKEIIETLQNLARTNEEQALAAAKENRELKAKIAEYTPDRWKQEAYLELKALADAQVRAEVAGEMDVLVRTRNRLDAYAKKLEASLYSKRIKMLCHLAKYWRLRRSYHDLAKYVKRVQKKNQKLKYSSLFYRNYNNVPTRVVENLKSLQPKPESE